MAAEIHIGLEILFTITLCMYIKIAISVQKVWNEWYKLVYYRINLCVRSWFSILAVYSLFAQGLIAGEKILFSVPKVQMAH